MLAALILGSRDNATKLHYDSGGEAKALVQVLRRKRIILFRPGSSGSWAGNALSPTRGALLR